MLKNKKPPVKSDNTGKTEQLSHIANSLLERSSVEKKIFFCPVPSEHFSALELFLKEKKQWLKKEEDSSADFFLLPIDNQSLDYKKNITKYQPIIIALHFTSEAHKKYIFPEMEAAGYRIYTESGAYVFFFLHKEHAQETDNFSPADSKIIISKLNYGKWKDSSFVQKTPGRLLTLPAPELLNANRFDIAIKAHYGRLWTDKMAKSWREYTYFEQALRITGPSKEIKEHDGSGKAGLPVFIENFHSLLMADTSDDFPYVPIDMDYIAMDGAHRIATSIINKEPVKTVQFKEHSHMASTAAYYTHYDHGHMPCPSDIIDESAIEYCRIKDTAAIALIFPCVSNPEKALEILEENSDIVYQKEIFMSPKAGSILLRQAYIGQEWVDFLQKQSGFNHKVKSCFPFSGKLQIVLLDNYKIQDLRPTKEKIRDLYELGKHSIHITDSTQETLDIARVLFNQNSINTTLKNTGEYLPAFHEKLLKFKIWIETHNINPEHICIDSSAILSVYGLRECSDIDFLYHGDLENLPPPPEGISCHNDIAHYYNHPINEIMGDPRLHFWYMGIKFCGLELIYEMKNKRGEDKDKFDIKLIKSISPHGAHILIRTINLLVLKCSWKLRSRLEVFKMRAKRKLREIFVRFGIMKDR